MTAPAISVVMSVFNGQAFLAPAIESILNQTFRDFEFIIIDDGSADKTSEILSAYASRDARIRTVRHENKGRTASLNGGISLARANYIARMDADDIALPGRLLQQIEFLRQHPEVGLLGGAVQLIDHSGKVFDTVRPPLSDSEIKSIMLRYNPMWHPTVVMRKEVLLAVGTYRTIFDESEDYDLFLRMGERCQIANLDKVVLRYRIHANQVSVRHGRHQVECVLAAAAAAEIRKRGGSDPLSGIDRITPKLLRSLGVTTAQVREALLAHYIHWIDLLRQIDTEAALGCTLQLACDQYVDRPARANAFLAAATIQYGQRRRAKALISAGRAVLLRPILAGRPAKRALTRLATAMRG